MRVQRYFQLEQPLSSIMLLLPSVVSLLKEPDVFLAKRDVCADGAPWRKSTAVIANSREIGRLNAHCPGWSYTLNEIFMGDADECLRLHG